MLCLLVKQLACHFNSIVKISRMGDTINALSNGGVNPQNLSTLAGRCGTSLSIKLHEQDFSITLSVAVMKTTGHEMPKPVHKIHELWANVMFARHEVAGSRQQVQARFGIRRGGGVSRIGVTGVDALVHIDTLALRSPSSRVHNGRVRHPCIPTTSPAESRVSIDSGISRAGIHGKVDDKRMLKLGELDTTRTALRKKSGVVTRRTKRNDAVARSHAPSMLCAALFLAPAAPECLCKLQAISTWHYGP